MSLWTRCEDFIVDLDAGPQPLPPAAVAQLLALLESMEEEMPPGSRRLADLIRLRTLGRFDREAKAYAGQVGRDWRDIMLASASYDLAISLFGCSTMSIATADGPILARNMDWWPEQLLARSTYTIHHHIQGGLRFTAAGWPGAIGVVTGMSARGFAVALNAVVAPDGVCKTGYPVLLHLRRVLEDAASFDEALEMLSGAKLAAGALLMLVGTRNDQRVVVERTPKRHALRWAHEQAPLIVTNDYRELDEVRGEARGGLYDTTCGRFDNLERLARSLSPSQPIDDEALLGCLTHSKVMLGITAQHTIFRPFRNDASIYVPTRLLQD